MSKKIVCLLCLLFMVVVGTCPAGAVDYKPRTIMMATANPEGGLHAQIVRYFAETLEKESNGKIKVKLFIGGSMGDEQANARQLKTQEIHAAYLAVGNLTPVAPKAASLMMPYMFPSIDNAYALFSNEEFMAKFNDSIAKECLARPLAWVVGGFRVLTNSKRPVTRIGDLQGMKIRVPPVAIQLETFRSWGVEPHPLSWSETFNGLQQGVVDGQENPNITNRDQKFYEVQKYVTNIHYNLGIWPLLVSENWYKRLDKDTQLLLNKVGEQTAVFGNALAKELEDEAIAECKSHGMVYAELEDETEWMNRARSVWPKFYDKVGGKALVDEMLRASEKK